MLNLFSTGSKVHPTTIEDEDEKLNSVSLQADVNATAFDKSLQSTTLTSNNLTPFNDTIESVVDSRYRDMLSCSIPEVELRGISIKQLKDVYAEIVDRCFTEGWTNFGGTFLTPDKVCLYDIKDRIIMKRTRDKQCSYVELIAIGPQKPTRFVSHWWGEPVIAMIRCLEQHCRDHELSEETTYYWICVSVCIMLGSNAAMASWDSYILPYS